TAPGDLACRWRAMRSGEIAVYRRTPAVVRPIGGSSMRASTARGVGVVWVVLMTVPRIATAERLFVPIEGLPSTARGIGHVKALGLDAGGLASLRASRQLTLTDFPLGGDGTATITVERFEPFTGDARAVVMEAGGPRTLDLPDQRYYRGRVDGDASSLVLVIAAADTARGYVATGGTIYRFGRDRTGAHVSWALRDADPNVFPGPGAFCDNDALADLVS